MLVKRLRRIGAWAVAGLFVGGAAGQETGPNMDFLEYLGAWEASDEDWMIVNELSPGVPEADAESDPRSAATEDESTEPNNES